MTTTVINIRGQRVGCRENYEYVGRPSRWGNPFHVGYEAKNNAEAVLLYQEWLLRQPDLLVALPTLRGKVLGCWCKPDVCHGDVLAALADRPELVQELRRDPLDFRT